MAVTSYRSPEHRKEAVAQVLAALDGAQRVVLTTHLNADGDGTGCQVALASWLRSQGKEAWIINPTPFPKAYSFLLPDENWSLDPASNRAREVVAGADLGMVLDTGETLRIGRVMELFQGLPLVVVDHHPPGDDAIEGVSFRDPSASATGELLFDLLLAGGSEPWPPEVARGLYVAILTDTGSFRFSNSSPSAHRVVAELLERGVNPETTYREVYGTVPLRKIHLVQASLETLESDPDAGISWMTVPTEAYEALGAKAEDVEGLVDYPRDVEGTEVGLLFRETAKGGTKISFRSNGRVDVNVLARRFGGGGHVKASGAMVESPMEVVRPRVLEETRRAVLESRGEP